MWWIEGEESTDGIPFPDEARPHRRLRVHWLSRSDTDPPRFGGQAGSSPSFPPEGDDEPAEIEQGFEDEAVRLSEQWGGSEGSARGRSSDLW
jgi:hypothetical protein